MKHIVAFAVFGLACSVLASDITNVEEKIWENLEDADTTNVLVTFKKANTKSAYERFHSLKLTSRSAKLKTQYAILKDHADNIQADVISMLNKETGNGKSHRISQLWITNELIVRNVDKDTVELLKNHPDVASLQAEWYLQLGSQIDEQTPIQANNTIQQQWGVANIAAPFVWDGGNTGQGVVVGVIDTGARHTHVWLSPTYRGNNVGQTHNYNWYSPTGQAAIPFDTIGQGTHVIGIASGTNGIGVAPGSRWIACRGCATAACANFDLLECGNWMACPTNTGGTAPDCDAAPHVINNSWGAVGNNPWFDGVIEAWNNVRIFNTFSIGNAGPGCSSLQSPGDRPGAIGVASIQANNQRSPFSSNGPTTDQRIAPVIGAPGTSVPSASHLDDTSLRTLSGTHQSAPHIAGVFALMLTRNPALTIARARQSLNEGALLHASVGATCGGIHDSIKPNNHVGYGRIYAPNAVNAAAIP